MSRPAPRFCPQCGSPLETRERFGRLRPVCAACGHTVFIDPKVAVAALVTRGAEVLLVRRVHDPGSGQWALPAGFIDPDEDPKTAAAREVLEETGLTVEIGELLELLHRPDPDGLADLVVVYAARPLAGVVRAGDDADAAGWFASSALAGLPIALATTERMLARWVAGTHEQGRS